MKILVGLSGGVDSAVTAYLLKKEGHDVTAGFMVNYRDPSNPNCQTRIDKEEAKKVAEYLEIPFKVFDYVDRYEEKVLNYMYEGYRKGITPNPDIMCNSEVKFRAFLDEAIDLGFEKIATGHYARVKNGKLFKGVDNNKDQSYFLAGLSPEQLSKAIFPIGELEKPEVRKIAKKACLPNAERKDSQGICFVGKVNMADFLEKKIKPKKGLVKDTSGKILGEHKGVFYYTIGQRKGLDIGGQEKPIFVIKKDLEKNEIIVGTNEDLELYSDKLTIKNINFINIDFEQKISNNKITNFSESKTMCKIRYRQKDQKCIIKKVSNIEYIIEFEEKQRAIAQGQICAIYVGDELVMSGVIN